MESQVRPLDPYFGMIPPGELHIAVHEYGLPEGWKVIPFLNINDHPLAISRRSETARKALLHTRNGDFMLKEVPWYCSDTEQVQGVLDLQERLARAGCPVPSIRRTRTGAPTVTAHGQHLFLQAFVHGRSWTGDPRQAEGAGRTLAEMHRVSRDLYLQGSIQLPSITIFTGIRGLAASLVQTLSRLGTGLQSEERDSLRAFVYRLPHRLRQCQASCKAAGYGTVSQPIHADYNPWNLVYGDDGAVRAVLDFDHACVDDPMRDLADAIMHFACISYRDETTRFQYIPENLDDLVGLPVLSSYLSGEPGAQRRLQMLPFLAEAVYLEAACLGLLRGDYPLANAQSLVQKAATIPLQAKRLIEKVER